MSGDELILGTLNSSNQQIVSILIVNVYLPTNYGSDESTSAFRKTIAELEGFLLSLMNDHVIIAGDILLKSALISLSLSTSCKPLISLGVIHVLISHSHTDAMITSPFPGLMMLFVLQLFWNTISNIMSTDSVDNFSDHLPMFFTLNCSTLSTSPPAQPSLTFQFSLLLHLSALFTSQGYHWPLL